jgi:hypothetical protein
MSYTSTPQYAFMAWCSVKAQGQIYLHLTLSRHEGVLGKWRYSSTHSWTLALDGGEWSASRPGRFTPRERAPGTHCIGGWVGPRDVLDTVVRRKIPSPRPQSNPRTSIVQSVAQRYTDWALTAQWGKIEVVAMLNHCAMRRRRWSFTHS